MPLRQPICLYLPAERSSVIPSLQYSQTTVPLNKVVADTWFRLGSGPAERRLSQTFRSRRRVSTHHSTGTRRSFRSM